MIKRIDSQKSEMIRIYFEGELIYAHKGHTVASALLEAGITHFQNTTSRGSRRGPFCMMGVCFDCLVEIDEQPNQQACMINVYQEMKIKRQANLLK